MKDLFWFCLLMFGSTRLLANITDEQGKSYNEGSKSQKSIPLVYKRENPSGHHTDVIISDPSALSVNNLLPDPLEWADGNGRVELSLTGKNVGMKS
ncbi:MAG: hypothetical protein PHC48_09975 [Prevotella sp.]|nr:hypothetical protein [Prevotella sp.]